MRINSPPRSRALPPKRLRLLSRRDALPAPEVGLIDHAAPDIPVRAAPIPAVFQAQFDFGDWDHLVGDVGRRRVDHGIHGDAAEIAAA